MGFDLIDELSLGLVQLRHLGIDPIDGVELLLQLLVLLSLLKHHEAEQKHQHKDEGQGDLRQR
ncbi:hypothetical protein D3C78_1688010 [compost metagenome]